MLCASAPGHAHGVVRPLAAGCREGGRTEGGDSPAGVRARCRLPPSGGDSRVEVDTVRSVGRHLVLELWGCRNLNSPDAVEQALREVVAACDVTLLDLRVYPFEPIGVTGVAVLAESHANIHTWPELGYAAIDIFTCGARKDPSAGGATTRILGEFGGSVLAVALSGNVEAEPCLSFLLSGDTICTTWAQTTC